MKFCVNCGKEIPDEAEFCPKCGAKVEVPTCPVCGKEVDGDDDFCLYCGERLHEPTPEPEPESKPEPAPEPEPESMPQPDPEPGEDTGETPGNVDPDDAQSGSYSWNYKKPVTNSFRQKTEISVELDREALHCTTCQWHTEKKEDVLFCDISGIEVGPRTSFWAWIGVGLVIAFTLGIPLILQLGFSLPVSGIEIPIAILVGDAAVAIEIWWMSFTVYHHRMVIRKEAETGEKAMVLEAPNADVLRDLQEELTEKSGVPAQTVGTAKAAVKAFAGVLMGIGLMVGVFFLLVYNGAISTNIPSSVPSGDMLSESESQTGSGVLQKTYATMKELLESTGDLDSMKAAANEDEIFAEMGLTCSDISAGDDFVRFSMRMDSGTEPFSAYTTAVMLLVSFEGQDTSKYPELAEIVNIDDPYIEIVLITAEGYEVCTYQLHSNHTETGLYVIPGSDKRLLSDADLDGYLESESSADLLALARDEIYARHGKKFDDRDTRTYFEEQSWYNGTIDPEDFTENILSEIERENIALIQGYEQKASGILLTSGTFQHPELDRTTIELSVHDGMVDYTVNDGTSPQRIIQISGTEPLSSKIIISGEDSFLNTILGYIEAVDEHHIRAECHVVGNEDFFAGVNFPEAVFSDEIRTYPDPKVSVTSADKFYDAAEGQDAIDVEFLFENATGRSVVPGSEIILTAEQNGIGLESYGFDEREYAQMVEPEDSVTFYHRFYLVNEEDDVIVTTTNLSGEVLMVWTIYLT